jgi:hypothetical protein
MFTIIFRSTAALACMAAPLAAAAQDGLLGRLLDKAGEVYAEKGYTPTGWFYQGSLRQSEEQRLTLTLEKGSQFQVVGACDTDCSDLDIELLDSDGARVDKDELEDDFPIVSVAKPGKYTARVVMTKCAKSPCGFALKAFSK